VFRTRQRRIRLGWLGGCGIRRSCGWSRRIGRGGRRRGKVVAKFESGPVSERIAFRGIRFVAQHRTQSTGLVTQIEVVTGPPEGVGVSNRCAPVGRKRLRPVGGLKHELVFILAANRRDGALRRFWNGFREGVRIFQVRGIQGYLNFVRRGRSAGNFVPEFDGLIAIRTAPAIGNELNFFERAGSIVRGDLDPRDKQVVSGTVRLERLGALCHNKGTLQIAHSSHHERELHIGRSKCIVCTVHSVHGRAKRLQSSGVGLGTA